MALPKVSATLLVVTVRHFSHPCPEMRRLTHHLTFWPYMSSRARHCLCVLQHCAPQAVVALHKAWVPCLVVLTADAFLHIFDAPDADPVLATPESAFGTVMPRIDASFAFRCTCAAVSTARFEFYALLREPAASL